MSRLQADNSYQQARGDSVLTQLLLEQARASSCQSLATAWALSPRKVATSTGWEVVMPTIVGSCHPGITKSMQEMPGFHFLKE